MQKTAMITGITGQDGAYLAGLLLQKGYRVVGTYRRSSNNVPHRLIALGIADQVELVPMELLEFANVLRTVEAVRPDEIYNLAAQSFVGMSFEQTIYTTEVDGLGTARLLEAVRMANNAIRYYQASTSEMFGKVQEVPQTERTPFYPRSPYGVAKLYAHWLTVNYREAHQIFACSGMLFNHESPLRGMEFVTRKITSQLAKIRCGAAKTLELGNLEAKRDWGFAGDYVRGMWLMLQQPHADDFVLATGETNSVRHFVERAADVAGFQLAWEGTGVETVGIDRKSGQPIVRVNPAYYRPAEVDLLVGDPSKARAALDWQSQVTFDGLVTMMMEADLRRAKDGQLQF